MRIDAYTHFIPEKYFNKIVESGHADIGKRVRVIPCIHDLDIRRKIVDSFKDYAQIISYPMRPLENGALGVQIYTNIAGKPLDDPAFEPFFAAMNRLNKPVWMHPARAANFPDYLSEKKSKYEIWWAFGWSYETAAAMARLVFSGIMDKYPNLKIITHHFGGIVPMLEGRIGPGWDQLGARTSDEDLSVILKRLKK